MSGYRADLPYVWDYNLSQEPLRQYVVAALQGVIPPRLDRTFAMLDLGCGNGVTLIAQAVAYPYAQFVGVDFDERHITQAVALTKAAGLDNVRFFHNSFEEFADFGLPFFDYIASHGVTSWVSQGTRDAMRRIVQRSLAPGGMLYLAYDNKSGNAAIEPLRRLWKGRFLAAEGTHEERVRASFAETWALLDVDAEALRRIPDAERLHEQLDALPLGLALPQYFGEHWSPHWFADVVAEYAELGIHWVGGASLGEPSEARVSPQARELAGTIDDRVLREQVLDMVIGDRFRADLFTRGPVPVRSGGSAIERPALGWMRFGAIRDPAAIASDEDAWLLEPLADTPSFAVWCARVGRPHAEMVGTLRRLVEAIKVRPMPGPPRQSTGRTLTPLNAALCRLAATEAINVMITPGSASVARCERVDLIALDALHRVGPERAHAEACAVLAACPERLSYHKRPLARAAADVESVVSASLAYVQARHLPFLASLGGCT